VLENSWVDGATWSPPSGDPVCAPPFRHDALFYDSDRQFADGTVGFIEDGLASGEPVMVVLSAPKIRLLEQRLGGAATKVRFADMATVGANPARIIAAWHAFAGQHAGRAFRGIAEPIWAGRSPAELVECQRHESLLNVAFAGAQGFRLLCPYDAAALDPGVLDEACRSHRHIHEDAVERLSMNCRGIDEVAAPFDWALPEPTIVLARVRIAANTLSQVRRTVACQAAAAALTRSKTSDLILAVNEVATNSVVHGGGSGTLRLWIDGDALVCEVTDAGRIDDPLIGRLPPADGTEGGRGLWLATQLCDLIQVRSFATGAAVRLHMRLS
jgi:anti-sigma regulatory factor (Ser/Thr protein kinase)